MFRVLANRLQTAQTHQPGDVFVAHPIELIDYLETVWALRIGGPPALPTVGLARPDPFILASSFPNVVPSGAEWRHLIYAFMIENTRIVEIFRRVLAEYRSGEKLGIAPEPVQHWLRNTETLFFREAPFDSVLSLTSEVRADAGAIRRNAYYRMFGMDLLHGTAENKPYPYHKADTANREFVTKLEMLLREAWVAIGNAKNQNGANPTDSASLQSHASRLQTMLSDRRQRGTLAREEFAAIATLSWFHLAVEFDSPVVSALEANASSPYERLRKIGDRVGLPAHAKSDDYFRLADAIASLLSFVEAADWQSPAGAASANALFQSGANSIRDDVNTVITHWAGATGRSLKVMATPNAA